MDTDLAATEIPVQKQLDAYNARDIAAFMACWSDDAQYCEIPDRLLASGAAAIRDRHIARFKEPMLFGKLIRRIAVGNLVVDQETVTRSFPEGQGEVDVIAIYQVDGGKITKADPERDFIRVGEDFYIGFLYGDVADQSEFLRSARSIWLEIKSDGVEEMTRRILDFGVRKLEVPDPHFYFQAPGGQCLRLVGIDEDLSFYGGVGAGPDVAMAKEAVIAQDSGVVQGRNTETKYLKS